MKIIFYTLLTHTTKKPRIPDMLLGHAAKSPYKATPTFLWGYLGRNTVLIFEINKVYAHAA